MQKTSGGEVIFLIIMCWFLYQCVFTNKIDNIGHEVFLKIGITDEIEKWDREIRNR